MSETADAISYTLSFQDVIEILRTIDATPDGHELALEIGAFTITVVKGPARPGRP